MRVCLVVLFNSPFVANIPVLEDLYAGRFDGVFFLTHKPEGYPNAVGVQGESYYFHNFLLQAFDRIRGFDYYVITHDDAILHPQVNKHDLWTRFGIPENAICLRNVDIVPRQSTWSWTKQWGYDVVDASPPLQVILKERFPQLSTRFVHDVFPLGLSKFKDAPAQLEAQGAPMLFGGGPNADLLFMPSRALEDLVSAINLLNFPGLFVEIVVPMAAMLTGWPVHLLLTNRHAPVHLPSRRLSPIIRLVSMIALDRVSHHPIKLGRMRPSTLRQFTGLYRWAKGRRGLDDV